MFLCINEGQANVNEEEQSIYDTDWGEEFRNLRERYDRGEIDVSYYWNVDTSTPDNENTQCDANTSDKVQHDILAHYRDQIIPRNPRRAQGEAQVPSEKRCGFAYTADIFPSKKIDPKLKEAKTVAVSCGSKDLDKSVYGRQESGIAEHLRGVQWSPNMFDEYNSVFMQAWEENFNGVGLTEIENDNSVRYRRKIYIDLTGSLHPLDDELRMHKGTHVDIMKEVLMVNGLKKRLS